MYLEMGEGNVVTVSPLWEKAVVALGCGNFPKLIPSRMRGNRIRVTAFRICLGSIQTKLASEWVIYEDVILLLECYYNARPSSRRVRALQLTRKDHRPGNIRTRVLTLPERTSRVICDIEDVSHLFRTEETPA